MALAKPVSQEKLAEYCRANGIKWLAAHDAEIVQRNFGRLVEHICAHSQRDVYVVLYTLLAHVSL